MKHKKIEKIETVREMLEGAYKKRPFHISYRYFANGCVKEVSVCEFYESVENLGAALCSLGLKKAHVACVGENSYPWIQTFLTVLMSEGVFVPLDKELPIENLVYLINDSDSEAVFCSKKYEEALSAHLSEMPRVRYLIGFDREDDREQILSMNRLIETGSRLDRTEYDSCASDPNALKYLVYTSGTTGIAKGVMLTEHNIVSGVYYGLQVSQISDTGLSVLPYHHTYEAVCDILVSIHFGATLCINDSLRHVQKNLVRFHPSFIYLVPAFSEHFYNSIQNTIRKQGKEKQFAKAIRLSNRLRKCGIDLRRVFFRSILKEFGGRLKKIVCGGAPIRPEIGAFFDEIGISLTGGYGITECSPLVSVNDDKGNNFASAGHRLPCLEWRIDSPDVEGVGEICVRGDVVMLGYYKRPDLTSEAIRDGWFYTGDYGFINDKDEVVITGRKKNIIVLNNGKNIYPEEIELLIGNIPFINEVVVRGIQNEFGQDTGLLAELFIEDPAVDRSLVPAALKKVLAELPGYKQIASIIYRTEPFQKTTTNKIKR